MYSKLIFAPNSSEAEVLTIFISYGSTVRRPRCFACSSRWTCRFVDDLESSFNLSILAQALCLSLIICCLGFAVINVRFARLI